MICLLVMTDGRDELLERTVASAEDMLAGPITERVMHDDTGSVAHAAELWERYPEFTVIAAAERLGFGGAIRHAWAELRARSSARFVFHLEDDFTFNRLVPLDLMAAVLDHPVNQTVHQLALRRQPWNDAERAAGGIVEQHPDDFWPASGRFAGIDGWVRWLEHRRFFTTNPSLYRRELLDRGWPHGEHSEGVFSHELFDGDDAARCAFFGGLDSGEWVTHIGAERAGTGY